MLRSAALVLTVALGSCAPVPSPAGSPPLALSPEPSLPRFTQARAAAMLREIDPLDGDWRLIAFDGPPIAATRRVALRGHEGAFLSTSGDCTSSFSSYVRDGGALEITRHIPPDIRKCEDGRAASLDRAVAHAVASARSWAIDGTGRLHLNGADGTGATFARPAPKRPDLDGRWLVESIGGKPFSARLDFGDRGVGASGGCNSYGADAAIGAATIAISNGAQTLIGCDPAREGADGILFDALSRARTWRIDADGALLLDGAASIVARRPAPVSYTLPGRYAACNNSTLPDLSHDGEVWLDFGPATVRDQAGCSARYETAGAALRLTLDDAPACRTPALPSRGIAQIGGSRSPLAQFRPDGFAWDEDGRLRLRTHRGVLALCKYTPG